MFKNIRNQFPLLSRLINGKPFIYMDNAATTQKPLRVLHAIETYYKELNSNVHRGVHTLSQIATDAYEDARKKVQLFIGAKHAHEIIFTKGTTEAINLVANGVGKSFFKQGDELILSCMEHHSNIVPWQLAAQPYGVTIKVIPVNSRGELEMEVYENLFTEKTKIVALTHASNILGTINPIKKMIDIAHSHRVPVLIDGAQGIKSSIVDVQELDCDFYCFSGHKIYAPMGIGVLYGKEKYLEQLPPYQGGGEMIEQVSFQKTTFNKLPFKFEAGTPNVEGAIGLSAAIDFMLSFGMEKLIEHENNLLNYAHIKLQEIENLTVIGTAKEKTAVISFLLKNQHPADVGTLIDMMGIAVRTGHHCAQPLIDFLHIPGTVRASFAVYNNMDEIDKLLAVLQKVNVMLNKK
ncbi:MAG: cysteine desulfurase [Bacteroidales bacterium]|jgi:cysteine desulfurase/selenocysteine lyase|nr:cysteine desulfurase [Bacteroidales bacterium]